MHNTDTRCGCDECIEQANRFTDFIDSQTAFEDAIASGRLSSLPGTENYAGLYMYMGDRDGVSLFKNINTRVYI
jgi:hypothetical protein